jgi:hypothetical protein
MNRYRVLLEEVLEKIERTKGKKAMKQAYYEFKEVGQEAMSREVAIHILQKYCTPEERERYLVRFPELKEILKQT